MVDLREVGVNLLNILLGCIIVVTGTMNTLFFKMMDDSTSKGSTTLPPSSFSHPASQTTLIFSGMLFVLLFHFISVIFESTKSGKQKKSLEMIPLELLEPKMKKKKKIIPIFLLPSCFEFVALTLMNYALIKCHASVFQMLSESFIFLSGILQFLILKKKKYFHHILGMLFILIGVGLVSFSSIYERTVELRQAEDPLTGIIVVLVAQTIFSLQFIFEELFLTKNFVYSQIQSVGYIGFFGISINFVMLLIFYFIPGSQVVNDFGRFENYPSAFFQVCNDPYLLIWVFGSILSICVYTFCGIHLSRKVIPSNLTEYSLINTIIKIVRIILIWLIEILLGREQFHWLQLSGFLMISIGSLLYNRSLKIPFYERWIVEKDEFELKKLNSVCKCLKKKKVTLHYEEIVDDEHDFKNCDINYSVNPPERT